MAGRPASRQPTAQTVTAPTSIPRRTPPGRSSAHPGLLIGLGLALIAFAIFMITIQIKTNEVFINHHQPDKIFEAQWDIWLQLPKLFLGNNIPGPALTNEDAISVIVGWGIEFFYIALLTAYEVFIHSTRRFSGIVAAIMRILSIGIVFYGFWTDANYGNVDGWSHLIFACVASLAVGFGPTWGITLLERGWKSL